MNILKNIRQSLSRILEVTVMLTMGLLVCIVMIQILARVFELQIGWTEELATFLLIWAGLLGASVGFSKNSHLGIDYFVIKLDKDSQKLLGIIAKAITIIFALYAMVWGGGVVVMDTLMREQLSTSLKIPMGYIYLALPISGLFIALFSIEQLFEIITSDQKQEGEV